MDSKRTNECPCGNGKTYENCCKKYHCGAVPSNALDLMRSRYSAYALNVPDYIIKTTHPASPQHHENRLMWRQSISKFSKSSSYDKLEILDFKENRSIANVTFTAYIRQNNQDATFTEKSYFEKVNGKWLYRNGQLKNGHAPNLITTDQLKMLPLAYYGDQILRKRAAPINEITDDIKILINEMIDTVDGCNGVGIAAPQVHHSIRLFIIRKPINIENNNFDCGDIEVFINPVLSEPSAETWIESEGCLSIPTIHSDVERPVKITVEYTDINGIRHKKRVSGWEAKIIMHENDHIDGVLFVDRTTKEEKKELKPLLNNLKKRIHDRTEL